jgi:hypothetical protein
MEVRETHVGQDLLRVHRRESADRLDLHDDEIFHDQVGAEGVFDANVPV